MLAMAVLHVHYVHNVSFALDGVYSWLMEIKQVLKLLSLPETGVENSDLLS